VQILCDELKADPQLQVPGGVNLMGVSQGGLLMRGFVERCNDPPAHNLILWVTPNAGQFGVPGIHVNTTFDAWLEEIVDCCVYDSFVQNLISFAGYWKDPWALDYFVKYSSFLADIDNARDIKNPLYKQRILSLANVSISYSQADKILQPKETGWWGFYKPNSNSEVMTLEESDIYIQDWIGLKTLDQSGRLHKFATDCDHGDYSSSCFDKYFTQNVLPFFNN